MMTIVTQVEIKDGAEREWDTTMAARMTEAKKRSGWVGGSFSRRSKIRRSE